MTLMLTLMAAASAGSCDVSALTQALKEASPVNKPDAFHALYLCDAGVAGKLAKEEVPHFLAKDGENPGVVDAITAGAGAEVSAWLRSTEMADRSKTLAYLGTQCGVEAVGPWFVRTHDADPESFWKERWFRGLDDCKVKPVQDLLAEALDDPARAQDRTQYFSIVEVYARNLGVASLPRLELLAANTPEAERRLVVSAFADAANVGSKEGRNEEAAKAAVRALEHLAPQLTGKTADQVRATLQALGAEVLAEQVAKYRWPERFSGTYTYVAAATETVTCKNGKVTAILHTGDLLDPGDQWPETLKGNAEALLTAKWGLGEAAAKCKGTSEITVEITAEPITGTAAAKEWLNVRRKAFRASTSDAHKTDEITHDPIK